MLDEWFQMNGIRVCYAPITLFGFQNVIVFFVNVFHCIHAGPFKNSSVLILST